MQKTSNRVSTSLDAHPSVQAVRLRLLHPPGPLTPEPLTVERVRTIALEAGADDAGVVSLEHPGLSGEVPYAKRALPTARSIVSLVVRMHPDDIRSPARSVANLEFHRAGHDVDEIAQRVARALSALGYPSINPAMAFPMEMDAFPGRTWVVSQKDVAVAAQLGRVGLHRSVIHPKFGSFILLGAVVTTAEVRTSPEELTFDPCVSCKLCVAACPVGAIEPSGEFRFSACYDHNYREFMTGFADYVEEAVDSKSRQEFRDRVSISESASMWQSLAYKPNYKAAYCIAVCPAGEDVLALFLSDRGKYLDDVVRPLTEKREPVYVVSGSDAEAHVKKRFSHKSIRVIKSSLRPSSAEGFFRAMPLTFQRGPAKGWRAVFQFDLSGPDPIQATVRIDDGKLEVENGLVGKPDVTVRGLGQVWLDIVTKKRSPVLAVMTRRLRVEGERRLLARFAACFPR
jgi:epoxyqueuosine reductase QueG